MRRVEPAFPDLLPVTHRVGGVPRGRGPVLLDPVDMRLRWGGGRQGRARRQHAVPARPVRALIHAGLLPHWQPFLTALLAAGSGLVVVLDEEVPTEALPEAALPGQVVVLAPQLPAGWGVPPVPDLRRWAARGCAAGVLLALLPTPGGAEELQGRVRQGVAAGAQFVAAIPVALPPPDRHRLYDLLAGEEGDAALENLLFHSDVAGLVEALEREASRACLAAGVAEFIPAPATATVSSAAARAISELLLWARRLDATEGINSLGWQVRRAARALLAAGKDPLLLAAEDNLRVVPGFDPWVEAFARSLWNRGGEPFDGVRERWLAT